MRRYQLWIARSNLERTVALAAMTAASPVALTEAFYQDETARVVAGADPAEAALVAGTGAGCRQPAVSATPIYS